MTSLGKVATRRHKWSIEFVLRDRKFSTDGPVGYTCDKITLDPGVGEAVPDLIVKKSWDIALGPLKQIPMNLFIMWMAGNTISIFPIMMVGMMFFRPIQAFFDIQKTFKMIEGNQALVQQIVYFLGNLVALGLAVYKCQVMGLLPTHPSDWLAFVEPQARLELSGGGVVL